MIARAAASDKPIPRKYSPPGLAEAVSTILNARRQGMRAAHKAVLFALAGRLPCIFPSADTLKEDAGLGRSKLYMVLKELEAWGMVRRLHPEDHASTVYELDLDAIGGSAPRTTGGPRDGRGVQAADSSPPPPVHAVDVKQSISSQIRLGPTDQALRPGGAGHPAERKRFDSQTGEDLTPPSGERDRRRPDPFGDRYDLPDVFTPGPPRCEREVSALLRRKESGEVAVSSVEHLVALHARGHEVAYRHLPRDLPGSKTWACAVTAAGRVVREVFSGDVQAAAAYVVWVWDREVVRARGDNPRPRPVGWRLVFGAMVSDYAIHAQRRARGAA